MAIPGSRRFRRGPVRNRRPPGQLRQRGRAGDTEQIGNQAAEITVVETIDQVLKQRQRQQQRHDARLAELQGRSLLTVLGDGRLHLSQSATASSW